MMMCTVLQFSRGRVDYTTNLPFCEIDYKMKYIQSTPDIPPTSVQSDFGGIARVAVYRG